LGFNIKNNIIESLVDTSKKLLAKRLNALSIKFGDKDLVRAEMSKYIDSLVNHAGKYGEEIKKQIIIWLEESLKKMVFPTKDYKKEYESIIEEYKDIAGYINGIHLKTNELKEKGFSVELSRFINLYSSIQKVNIDLPTVQREDIVIRTKDLGKMKSAISKPYLEVALTHEEGYLNFENKINKYKIDDNADEKNFKEICSELKSEIKNSRNTKEKYDRYYEDIKNIHEEFEKSLQDLEEALNTAKEERDKSINIKIMNYLRNIIGKKPIPLYYKDLDYKNKQILHENMKIAKKVVGILEEPGIGNIKKGFR
jgi:hypothetical protein